MANNDRASVTQCKCGEWFNNHESGKCKRCRQLPPKRARKSRAKVCPICGARPVIAGDLGSLDCQCERKPAVGSQEWAETRGDDLGDSPDY